MTRKEQIEKAAEADALGWYNEMHAAQWFARGAEWADNNPLDYCRKCFDREAKEYMERSIDRFNYGSKPE